MRLSRSQISAGTDRPRSAAEIDVILRGEPTTDEAEATAVGCFIEPSCENGGLILIDIAGSGQQYQVALAGDFPEMLPAT